MTSCAVCARPITGAPAHEPLGRDDAMVAVCATGGCSGSTSVRLGPERGYDVPTGPRVGAILPAFAAGALRVTGSSGKTAPPLLVAAAQPGWIVERVLRMQHGKPLDAREAKRLLCDQPWFTDLRHLGSDAHWHLFERPDAEAAARARQGETTGVGALEQYRSPPLEGVALSLSYSTRTEDI